MKRRIKPFLKKVLGLAAATSLLIATGLASAATTTQNITLAGTISPPPATCSFGAPPAISFNGPASTYNGTAVFYFNVTCTANTAYSLSPVSAFTPVSVGSSTAYVQLYSYDGTNTGFVVDGRAPSFIGTGSLQQLSWDATLWGDVNQGDLDPQRHFGVVSGTLQMLVAY